MEELCDHVITFWNSKNILRKWLLCVSGKGPVAVPKPPVTDYNKPESWGKK